MGKNTRYDALREKIRRNHSRSRTFRPAFDMVDSKLIFDVDDENFVGNNSFFEYGPYNFVTIRNFSSEDLTVYPTKNRDTVIRVPAAPSGAVSERVAIADIIPSRYVGFLRVEVDGSAPIAEGDVEIQVGSEVDSVEMDILKMSGLLNLEN